MNESCKSALEIDSTLSPWKVAARGLSKLSANLPFTATTVRQRTTLRYGRQQKVAALSDHHRAGEHAHAKHSVEDVGASVLVQVCEELVLGDRLGQRRCRLVIFRHHFPDAVHHFLPARHLARHSAAALLIHRSRALRTHNFLVDRTFLDLAKTYLINLDRSWRKQFQLNCSTRCCYCASESRKTRTSILDRIIADRKWCATN